MVRKYFGRARTFITNRYSGFRGRMGRIRSHKYYGSAMGILPVAAGAGVGYITEGESFKYQNQIALALAVADGIPGVGRFLPKPIRGFAKGYIIGRLIKGIQKDTKGNYEYKPQFC